MKTDLMLIDLEKAQATANAFLLVETTKRWPEAQV